jgi:hypothetical protein
LVGICIGQGWDDALTVDGSVRRQPDISEDFCFI